MDNAIDFSNAEYCHLTFEDLHIRIPSYSKLLTAQSPHLFPAIEGLHFLLRSPWISGYFPADQDTTPKSVSTFFSYVIAPFTASEKNPVSQQRSCDNELCRNTKNQRYLDPARSSHV